MYSEYFETEAEARAAWLVYCIDRNGWEAKVPPFPPDVPAHEYRKLGEQGRNADDSPDMFPTNWKET
jgi:hypothetical protein